MASCKCGRQSSLPVPARGYLSPRQGSSTFDARTFKRCSGAPCGYQGRGQALGRDESGGYGKAFPANSSRIAPLAGMVKVTCPFFNILLPTTVSICLASNCHSLPEALVMREERSASTSYQVTLSWLVTSR